jgi:hypothetical protein
MRELGPGTRTVIDIEHVHNVDALEEKALHWLNRVGARLICAAYRHPFTWRT